MSRAVGFVLGALGVLMGLLVEHIGHGWEQPLYVPVLDLGIGWVLIGSGIVGAIVRPSQPAGRRLILAGFLWFVGTPRQDQFLILDDLAFAFQGYFDLVLVLIALSFPWRWPARRSERLILVALAVVFGVQSVIRLVARSSDFGPAILDQDFAFVLVAWVDVTRSVLFVVSAWLLIRRWYGSSTPLRRLIVPVIAAVTAAALAEGYRFYYPLTQLHLAPAIPD